MQVLYPCCCGLDVHKKFLELKFTDIEKEGNGSFHTFKDNHQKWP